MSSNQSQITFRCETLGHKCFVGRVVSDQGNGMLGKTVFLDQIIPGEEAHIEIVKDKRNYAHGSVLAVLSESSERVKPPCEYFDACGGCDMQHIDVAAQRKFKREFVESSLLKKFGSLPKRGVVLAGEGLPSVHYRNRIQLHIDADGNTGFYRRGSRSIVAISKCLIADRSLNEAIEKIQSIPKKELAAAVCVECLLGESVMVIVHPRRSHRQLPAHGFPLLKKQFPDLQIMSKSPGAGNVMSSFAQVNMEGNKVLQACVRDLIEGKQITEFYAGSGNFCLDLAALDDLEIDAIELDTRLVELGKEQVKSLSLVGQVNFIAADASIYAQHQQLKSTVLLDPPRAGAREVVERLTELVHTVVYVSCYLPSLLRDIEILTAQGFSLIETRVIDMFPHTYHVETVSLLKKAPHR